MTAHQKQLQQEEQQQQQQQEQEQQEQEQQQPPKPGAPTVTFAPAAPGAAGRHQDRPPGELRTWSVEPGAPGDYLPEWLSNTLDFVVVFGGDGTVLWTCHIFGNRSMPPLVPFNLGSLGFLTPFDPAAARHVLGRVVRGERGGAGRGAAPRGWLL
jgi:NAD+ kinase